MEFGQLWPPGDPVEIEAHVLGLRLGAEPPEGRPFTVANFVASVDGRASVQGRSGGLGDDGDKALFRSLRRAVEAVLVGTRTLEVERYGRIIPDAQARRRRVVRGLSPEPLTVILTRSGRLPLDIPLFAEPEARVLVFCSGPVDLAGARAQVEVVALAAGETGFAAALDHLRRRRGVRTLLCEGGPTLFGSLLRERLVDQLFLSLAPKLAGGGDAPAITGGPALPEPAQLRLDGALERHGTLFLRYAITG